MGTRAAIVLKTKDGYSAIYNHWDGYPDYLGTLLHAHYKSYGKVKDLISLGSVSAVRESVAPRKGDEQKHTFSKPLEYVTIAYGRDAGEPINITKVQSLAEIDFGEYLYLYIPSTGEWETYKSEWDTPWKWKKIEVDYDKYIKEWIQKDYFSIHPRGYDKETGLKIK